MQKAFPHIRSVAASKLPTARINQNRVTDVEEISGNGVTAKVDGTPVAVGNVKLMKRIGVEAVECHQVGTVIHVAIDGAYAGHILISDVPKPTSKDAIANLKKNGIKETVMLTGDIDRVAQQVAGELGVDRVYSELLPADKVSKVEELLAKKSEKRNLPSLVTESTMHRYFPEQTSVSQWELWVPTLRSRQPMWS